MMGRRERFFNSLLEGSGHGRIKRRKGNLFYSIPDIIIYSHSCIPHKKQTGITVCYGYYLPTWFGYSLSALSFAPFIIQPCWPHDRLIRLLISTLMQTYYWAKPKRYAPRFILTL